MSILEDIDTVLGAQPDLFENIAGLVFPGTADALVLDDDAMWLKPHIECGCSKERMYFTYISGEVIPEIFIRKIYNDREQLICSFLYVKHSDGFTSFAHSVETHQYLRGLYGLSMTNEICQDQWIMGYEESQLLDWQE